MFCNQIHREWESHERTPRSAPHGMRALPARWGGPAAREGLAEPLLKFLISHHPFMFLL